VISRHSTRTLQSSAGQLSSLDPRNSSRGVRLVDCADLKPLRGLLGSAVPNPGVAESQLDRLINDYLRDSLSAGLRGFRGAQHASVVTGACLRSRMSVPAGRDRLNMILTGCCRYPRPSMTSALHPRPRLDVAGPPRCHPVDPCGDPMPSNPGGRPRLAQILANCCRHLTKPPPTSPGWPRCAPTADDDRMSAVETDDLPELRRFSATLGHCDACARA
jgi:hypothetical protein